MPQRQAQRRNRAGANAACDQAIADLSILKQSSLIRSGHDLNVYPVVVSIGAAKPPKVGPAA